MMKPVLLLGTFVLAVTSPLQAAAVNEPPPLGAILDLGGTPIPGGGNNTAQMYMVNFVGVVTNTAVAFVDSPFLCWT